MIYLHRPKQTQWPINAVLPTRHSKYQPSNRILRLCVTAVFTLLIAACDTGSNKRDVGSSTIIDAEGVSFDVPEFLKIARVDQDNLFPTAFLNSTTPLTLTRTEDGLWTGSAELPVGASYGLRINWFEDFNNVDLQLATISVGFTVQPDGQTVLVGSDTYNTEFDRDSDGDTNLEERTEGTDPLDPNDSSDPLSGVNVIIPRIDPAAAPIIDGQFVNYQPNELVLAGEWSAAAQQDQAGAPLLLNQLIADDGSAGTAQYYHQWAAMHDGEYLYIIVVSDDANEHVNDSVFKKIFEDDAIELYFDGDNSKGLAYDGIDDRQIHIGLLAPESTEQNISSVVPVRIVNGVNSADLPSSLEFVTGPRAGPRSPRAGAGRQDIYEIQIALSDLGITPGVAFGFEVQLNDDDDGDNRDHKWAWYHRPSNPDLESEDNDQTWKQPSLMGTAILAR